jgi:hypothetical protein
VGLYWALPRRVAWRGSACHVIGQGPGRCHITPSAARAIGAAKSIRFENKKINSVKFESSFKKVLKIKKIRHQSTMSRRLLQKKSSC